MFDRGAEISDQCQNKDSFLSNETSATSAASKNLRTEVTKKVGFFWEKII